MSKKTPLFDEHLALDAKMVDFGGWSMPINYGSQIKEHEYVRQDVGMFDVSHMGIADLEGDLVIDFLRKILANDIARLKANGKAMYSCMLNEEGGVIDDLIVYYMNDNWCRMVINASTKEKDLAWISQKADIYSVEVKDRTDLSMIALQGPNAEDKLIDLIPEYKNDIKELQKFFAIEKGEFYISRTGYTGEDGFEIMLPKNSAAPFWRKLVEIGVKPCGLGARDTLRLEAGMNLYGTDMDEQISPLESGLEWTVAWQPEDRNFIGRKPLEVQKNNGLENKLVGVILKDRGVCRGGQKVIIEGIGEGVTTSGTFSPTLKKAIAFARVPTAAEDKCKVEIRGKALDAKIVKLPFVRNGKASPGILSE